MEQAHPWTSMGSINRYWYIYEAHDIDLADGTWRTWSSSGTDWDRVTPEAREAYEEIEQTGWDGTGDWYEREQDRNIPIFHHPLVQVVHKPETDAKHLVSLVPFPERGDPLFIFWLPYMPFFLERREDDVRYNPGEHQMSDMNGMTRVDCHYYGLQGSINHVPAWRHFQTVTHRMEVGGLRLDGEWYRRSIRNDLGEAVPALGIWNPDTDITVVIVKDEFGDKDRLISEVQGPVLPEQLRAEEWMSA